MNERAGHQARELETVYVPSASEGCYLKLLLHKCHVNEHNLYSQIGALGSWPVRAIGPGPGAHADGPAIRVEPLSLQQATARPVVPPEKRRAPHEERGAAMDPSAVAMINELGEQKRSAVAAVDFDAAKRLKARIAELRAVGVRLADLDRQKAHAVANEDYDMAKAGRSRRRLSSIARGGSRASVDAPAARARRPTEPPAARRSRRAR